MAGLRLLILLKLIIHQWRKVPTGCVEYSYRPIAILEHRSRQQRRLASRIGLQNSLLLAAIFLFSQVGYLPSYAITLPQILPNTLEQSLRLAGSEPGIASSAECFQVEALQDNNVNFVNILNIDGRDGIGTGHWQKAFLVIMQTSPNFQVRTGQTHTRHAQPLSLSGLRIILSAL